MGIGSVFRVKNCLASEAKTIGLELEVRAGHVHSLGSSVVQGKFDLEGGTRHALQLTCNAAWSIIGTFLRAASESAPAPGATARPHTKH
jgi:hypothetical protein